MTDIARADTSEFSFTDADFKEISAIANSRYGLFLQDSKRALVYSRLTKRLRALNLPTFKAYCNLLTTPTGAEEHSHFLSALTTNVTHFFREKHHFDQLREEVLPSLQAQVADGKGLRIWSAACSKGQEAFSVAAVVTEVFPDAARQDIKILATDVDPEVVAFARRGDYPEEERQALPAHYRDAMIGGPSAAPGHFAMDARLRSLISFGCLNLMDKWPMRRSFDVIFCRNAAIYFDKQTQARLWSRFADILHPGGYLMIGHSERMSGPAAASFRNVGVTAYQKITAG